MRELLFILMTLAGLAVLEVAFYGARYMGQRQSERLRLRLRAVAMGRQQGGGLLRSRRLAGSDLVHSALSAMPLTDKLEALLEQADSPMTVAQLFVYSGLAGTGAFIGGLALRTSPLICVVLGVGAGFVPILGLLLKRDQRSQKISEQLPDCLEMMGRALRAGNAISNSLQIVAAEMPEPINIEFARAYEEQRLGVSVERAVVNMTDRVPGNRDLRIVAVSLVVQKETGGNLAEILDGIAKTIRERYRFYGKVRALTAEGRVSGIILGFLPIGMTLFLLTFNNEYLKVAIEDEMGQSILTYAVGSWAVGVLWLHRLTKVDF